MMKMRTEIACVQCLVFRSLWIASCLPRAEAALRAAPRVVRAIDRAVGFDNFNSVMDAAVAAVLPELREPIARFYAGRGPRLADGYSAEAVARFDAGLAAFVEAAAHISRAEIGAALAVVQAHG